MSEDKQTVWINGATVELEYARAGVAEARESNWSRAAINDETTDHVHCIVCGIAIAANSGLNAFTSGTAWLCDACWARFIHFAEAL